MLSGLTVKMCLAFAAGTFVGVGAGCWGTSLYYESRTSSNLTSMPPLNFAKMFNAG